MVLTLATLGAALVVLALQDRNLPAVAALIVAGAMTLYAIEPDLRRKRLGATGQLALAVWALSLAGGAGYIRFVAT